MSSKDKNLDSSASSDSDSSSSSSDKEENEFEVEKIVDYRKLNDGTEEYLIRWKGYTPADDTWEEKENLKCPDKLAEFHREHEKKKKKAATTGRSKKNSRSRTRTFSTVSRDSTEDSYAPSEVSAKKRPSKSITPSRVIKTRNTSSTSDSNAKKPTKSTTLKDVPLKAPAGYKSNSPVLSTPTSTTTPKGLSKSVATSEKTPSAASTPKPKNGTSKLFDKNPPGAREVNEIEPSMNFKNNSGAPTPSTLVKISKILADNPPLIKEEISELSSSILSSGKSPVSNKTAMNEPTTSTADYISVTTDIVTTVVGTSSAIDETINKVAATGATSTSNDTVTPASKNSTSKERKNSRKQNAHIEKGAATITAAAAAPVTKKKKKKAIENNDDDDAAAHNLLWNMATTNCDEATIGIVEGRPLNNIAVEEVMPDSGESEISSVIIPDDHKCFGNSPTIFEFAENVVIHNVNNQKMEYIFSKTWKMRCTECTEKYTVNDNTVEYAYCFLSIKEFNYLMIKLNKHVEELFLIDADLFRSLCPKKYSAFVCITQEYFDTLSDLGLAVEDQKAAVEESFNNSILEPYKTGGTIDFAILETLPPEVLKAVREISRLFFLELQLAIGNFMCRVVDVTQLHKFVMDFYESRDQMFKIVRKEAVENIYETLFMSLVSEPSDF